MKLIEYPKNRYSGETPWLDKNWLYYMYVVQDYTSKEIADMYGCKASTITTYVSRYGLEKIPKNINDATEEELRYYYFTEERPPSHIAPLYNAATKEIRQLFREFNIPMTRTKRKASIDDYNLDELYNDKNYSINKIAKITGSNRKTITRRLEELNIDKRTHAEAQFVYHHGDIASKIMDHLDDRDWIYTEYVTNRKSATAIAEYIGCERSSVIRRLNEFDIGVRDNSESKIGIMVGDKHPNWQGGITELNALCRQYFHTNIRPKVLSRDGYKCSICGSTYSDEPLHVHHLYNFSNIMHDICNENEDLDITDDRQELYNIIVNHSLFNELSLLITLCESCHWFDIHGYEMRDY